MKVIVVLKKAFPEWEEPSSFICDADSFMSDMQIYKNYKNLQIVSCHNSYTMIK